MTDLPIAWPLRDVDSIFPPGGGAPGSVSIFDPTGLEFEDSSLFWDDLNNAFGINTSSPNASCVLDITSTTKGVLIPRMTSIQRDLISTPANGLEVYNITDNVTQFFNDTEWKKHVFTPANTLSTTGGVAFVINVGEIEAVDDFFWDNINKRLGVNTATPSTSMSAIDDSEDEGFNIKHSNLSQGIAIGYTGIKKTGTNTNSDLRIDAKGTGDLTLQTIATGKVKVGGTLDVLGVGLFGVPNVSETILGLSANTTGHEGVSLHHDGIEAFLVSVDSGVAWHDFTIQSQTVKYDLNGGSNDFVFDGTGITIAGGNRTINSSGGNLTLSASVGNDVLIGDDVTVFFVDGGTGFVGLGLSAPLDKLHITSMNTSEGLTLENTGGSGGSLGIYFENAAGQSTTLRTSSNGDMLIATGVGFGTTRLTIDSVTGGIIVAGDLTLKNGTTIVDGALAFDRTNEDLSIGDGSVSKIIHLGVWKDWTPVFTGFSVNPVVTAAKHIIIGKMVTVRLQTGNGTSNAGTFTVTLPVAAASTGKQFIAIPQVTDNGAFKTTPGLLRTNVNSITADVYINSDQGATSWAALGGKKANFVATYESN